jgi:hypothetical protein
MVGDSIGNNQFSMTKQEDQSQVRRPFDRRTGELNGSIFGSARFTLLLTDYEKCSIFAANPKGLISMKPRLRIALILLLVAVLGEVFWQAVPVSEPVYQGKPLGFWLEAFELENFPGKPNFNEAVDAVRDAGTNAVPILLRTLRVSDSDWKQRLTRLAQRQRFIRVRYVPGERQNWAARQAFMALNRGAVQFAVPSLVEINRDDVSRGETNSWRHRYSAEILELLKAREKM